MNEKKKEKIWKEKKEYSRKKIDFENILENIFGKEEKRKKDESPESVKKKWKGDKTKPQITKERWHMLVLL